MTGSSLAIVAGFVICAAGVAAAQAPSAAEPTAVSQPSVNLPRRPPNVEWVKPDAAQQQLGDKLVAAIGAHDPEQMKALLAPAVKACATEKETAAHIQKWAVRRSSFRLAKTYEITVAKIDPPPVKPPGSARVVLPVIPTHSIRIRNMDNPRASTTSFFIAVDQGVWGLLASCLTGYEIARRTKFEAAQGEHLKRAQQLYSQLKDPLLSELKATVAGGKVDEAIMKYQTATSSDRRTAADVISYLMSQNPPTER